MFSEANGGIRPLVPTERRAKVVNSKPVQYSFEVGG